MRGGEKTNKQKHRTTPENGLGSGGNGDKAGGGCLNRGKEKQVGNARSKHVLRSLGINQGMKTNYNGKWACLMFPGISAGLFGLVLVKATGLEEKMK